MVAAVPGSASPSSVPAVRPPVATLGTVRPKTDERSRGPLGGLLFSSSLGEIGKDLGERQPRFPSIALGLPRQIPAPREIPPGIPDRVRGQEMPRPPPAAAAPPR